MGCARVKGAQQSLSARLQRECRAIARFLVGANEMADIFPPHLSGVNEMKLGGGFAFRPHKPPIRYILCLIFQFSFQQLTSSLLFNRALVLVQLAKELPSFVRKYFGKFDLARKSSGSRKEDGRDYRQGARSS
ncbi:hypothetical protein AKJ36_01595 [candidate division MSBL1 archaeon SCGC-AAA259I07]|uniref:Uncharacterized protein n=1 Tax=candidate division MSBL1 archaeon SCGC-AAA259I07 TaxID=1698266 RepID=A0A133ULR5_9EURY|nr:hypothetical protein AKJ36_01595 [candidate division MSBL1 archaeon SCGC-AAA259I07]